MYKITGNGASTISSYSHSHIQIILCCPVDNSRMQFMRYSVVSCFWPWQNFMWIPLYLAQSKCTEIHWHEIPSIGRNALEILCVPLFTEFLPDLYKMFQVASVYDTNVECQIWRFCCNLFLSYVDKRHTDAHTYMRTKR